VEEKNHEDIKDVVTGYCDYKPLRFFVASNDIVNGIRKLRFLFMLGISRQNKDKCKKQDTFYRVQYCWLGNQSGLHVGFC